MKQKLWLTVITGLAFCIDTMDALLLKAANTEDNIAEDFLRLAKQKQEEHALLREKIRQIETGQLKNSDKPVQILELTQHLATQYVTLPSPNKRQIADSCF